MLKTMRRIFYVTLALAGFALIAPLAAFSPFTGVNPIVAEALADDDDDDDDRKKYIRSGKTKKDWKTSRKRDRDDDDDDDNDNDNDDDDDD